ncbi:MAG: phosphoribosylformylglycinamidine synthase subunit PurS [Methanomicrobiales archaeon]|jgi:phosphoribosylformylglycinamidine synthase|nr:phosphoribosylformylglycinamidine synthase subunit PurS [Methanomicrobiales archaeon]
MNFTACITVGLKDGMLDPEATTILKALNNQGFHVESLKAEQKFTAIFEATSKSDAHAQAVSMCEQLLANPVIQRYEIEVF